MGGEVRGKVTVSQEKKTAAPRRYFKGPYRSGHTHGVTQDGPENVVVYFPDLTLPAQADHVAPVMRQINERFVPHVLAMTRGDSVRFTNEDDFYHNVFSVVSGDRFDLGRFASGEKTASPFDTPGVVVVRCEIHPRMKAYILVLETTAFVVPDSSGAFVFSVIPNGRHRVTAWHPIHGSWEGNIEVTNESHAMIDISF
jgi:plastocyanin